MHETVIINNWIYSGKYIDEFTIRTPMDYLPDSLNKYYSLSKYSIEAITNSYIYVNHPMEFNDPYDSVRQFTFEDEDRDGYYEFNLMFLNMGLISMSESNANLLMWAHYSNHDGFLVNFKLESLKQKFQFIFPMNYIDTLPDIRIPNKPLKFMISTNLKSTMWRYEQEWRLYYNATPMLLPEKGNSYRNMNDEWIYKGSRTPKERKVRYEISDINFVTLGYKFILGEEHDKINNDTILLNLKDKFKLDLVDYLIEKGIPIRMISYGKVSEFGLTDFAIRIRKLPSESEFKYELKYIA